ncbi:MAG: ATPase [Bacteroidaceae bacterium]|nr:ATPase [Bacteroidaceae bacterium]
MKILIADSGSTKTEWAAVVDGEMIRTLTTEGMNPYQNNLELESFLKQIHPLLKDGEPSEVFFYGAGCKGDGAVRMKDFLQQAIPNAKITINSDMLGAARSVLGNLPGIACILGTGSNSCLFDGQEIVQNISPLGYVLGDEGSGASLGKHLVNRVFKGELNYLKTELFNEYGVNEETILERVYRKPYPNRFLASLAPFLHQYRNHPSVHDLIVDEFKNYFKRNIERYEKPELHVSCVGSIAWWFKEELQEAANAQHITIKTIVQKPLEGLVEYHTKKLGKEE